VLPGRIQEGVKNSAIVRRIIVSLATGIALGFTSLARAAIGPAGAVFFLDHNRLQDAALTGNVRVSTNTFGRALEFVSPTQHVEVRFTNGLNGTSNVSVGGWFFPRRSGEQYFLTRGVPDVGANGERFFRRQSDWVNFVLGTDPRGFLLGTINGNSIMPFPLVTVEELTINRWHQLVVTKTADGVHHFYHNGAFIWTDRNANAAGKAWPFVDTAPGEPLRLAMPLGGLIAEAWVFSRALSADEIAADFFAKRSRYSPALTPVPVALRDMNAHFNAGLWKSAPTREAWPSTRREIERHAREILGHGDVKPVPLDARREPEVDCGAYTRQKVSFNVHAGDRIIAWLLVPRKIRGRVPAIICFYGTTSGAGKDVTVGLSGRSPGSAPHPNLSFAVDMAEAGFVALAPDYLRDGERIRPGRRPYDTTDFYREFPEWSVHGKDLWDTSRAIDFLETLKFVDAKAIGMVGHSYGGHSTIFCTALDPRIKAAVANGPVSDFLHHGLHWAAPKGGGNSQSLPAMRPYVLDQTQPPPITFYEFTSLIAPRPLLVGQAAGERRPMEEENHAAVRQVYEALGVPQNVRYVWYAGDHDMPPEMRRAAVEFFARWLRR
jgi:hypothetical protein